MHFRDGQELQRGAPMFSIDAPFTAELARPNQLASARNAAALADTEVARARKLLEAEGGVAAGGRPSQEPRRSMRSAAVSAAEGGGGGGAAERQYTQIRALIAGRASRLNVTPGNARRRRRSGA